MPHSAAPAVVDALYATLSAASQLADVQVLDGPFVTNNEPAQLGVGTVRNEEEGGPGAVTGTFRDAGLGRRREDVVVELRASAWSGDTDMRPMRDRVYGMLNAVADVLRADRTLGEAVVRARLGPQTVLSQTQLPTGPWAVLEFSVHCEAFPD